MLKLVLGIFVGSVLGVIVFHIVGTMLWWVGQVLRQKLENFCWYSTVRVLFNFVPGSDVLIVFLAVWLSYIFHQHSPQLLTFDNKVSSPVVQALSFAMGLIALVSLAISFVNSFVGKDENDIYLGINRDSALLQEQFSFRCLSSVFLRLMIAGLFLIPTATAVLQAFNFNQVDAPWVEFNESSWPYSIWLAFYAVCLLVLIGIVGAALSMLWHNSRVMQGSRQRVNRIIERKIGKEHADYLNTYIRSTDSNTDHPVTIIKFAAERPEMQQSKLDFWKVAFGGQWGSGSIIFSALGLSRYCVRKSWFAELMEKLVDRLQWFSTLRQDVLVERLRRVRRYMIEKWKYLDSLKSNETTVPWEFIRQQYSNDFHILRQLRTQRPNEYKEAFADQPVSPSNRLFLPAFGDYAIDQPVGYITDVSLKYCRQSNNIVEIGSFLEHLLQLSMKDETAQYVVDTNAYVVDQLTKTLWKVLQQQVWATARDEKEWLKGIIVFDREGAVVRRLYRYLRNESVDAVTLEAVFGLLPLAQQISYLIFLVARNNREGSSTNPFAEDYGLYKKAMKKREWRLLTDNHLQETTQQFTSTLQKVQSDLANSNVSHFYTDDMASALLEACKEDRQITSETMKRMDNECFGFINFLMLRSCLGDGFEVSNAISQQLLTGMDDEQRGKFMESMTNFSEKYPHTIANVIRTIRTRR